LVIKEELRRGLKTTASILHWRHVAIAISRRHLPEGKQFKRDYGLEETSTAMDLQAAHSTKMASCTYARDFRMAPGQVENLRAEFRDLSRHWHTCIGFGVALPPRDSVQSSKLGGEPLSERPAEEVVWAGMVRSRVESERELNEWMRREGMLRNRKKRRPIGPPVGDDIDVDR
jgi:hypothetical protein